MNRILPPTMRGVVLRTCGPASNLVPTSGVPVISPVNSQICVQVAACAVAYRDILDRKGAFPFIKLPTVPGHELAGIVAAVGDKSSRFTVGQKVVSLHWGQAQAWPSPLQSSAAVSSMLGLMCPGGYAEYCTTEESAFCPVPPNWTAHEAAPVMSTFGTVWQGAMVRGRLLPGQHVLVTGASGGVGSAAVLLCKAFGCRVTAVTSNESKVEFLKQLGADHVLVSSSGDNSFHKLQPRGSGAPLVDMCIECVGGPTMNSSLRVVRPGGTLVVVGNVTNSVYQLPLGYIILNSINICGSDSIQSSELEKLFAFLDLHKIKPVISKILPLEDAAVAHELMESMKVSGRIVLDINSLCW